MAAFFVEIAFFMISYAGPLGAIFILPDNDTPTGRDTIEEGIWTIFQASPKNVYGRLDVDVAALALQRQFSRERDWLIEVNDVEFRGRLSKLNQDGRGFSTRRLVEAVEAVDGLISSETQERLARAYEASNASAAEVYGADKLVEIMKMYAESVFLPAAYQSLQSPAAFADELRLNFDRRRLSSGTSSTPDQYSFEDALSMVGDFMTQLSTRCTLQLVPPSTCLAVGQHHAVCCKSAPEVAMRQLERKLQAPVVSPELLIRAVKGVSLAFMGVKRCPLNLLESELYSIAEQNGGTVPLHGESFSAWLGHAFSEHCAPSDQPRVEVGVDQSVSVRSLLPQLGLQDLARAGVAGLIGLTMLRAVLSHLQVANGALRGEQLSEKQKK